MVQNAVDYPITPKEHGIEFVMDNRHLWLRSSQQWAIMRVRATLKRAIIDFFDERGFLNIDTPILTPNAAEGRPRTHLTIGLTLRDSYVGQDLR